MAREINESAFLAPALPYGIISTEAFGLAMYHDDDGFAFEIYSPAGKPYVPMEQRVENTDRIRARIRRLLHLLYAGGYLTDGIRTIDSKNKQKVRYYRLTASGISLLTASGNPEAEWERRSKKQATDALTTFVPFADPDLTVRNDLIDRAYQYGIYAASNDPAVYEQKYRDALDTQAITILAGDFKSSRSIDASGGRYGRHEIYRQLRNTDITALFRSNNYLTYLDRRPLCDAWAVDGLDDVSAVDDLQSAGQMDLPAYCFRTLTEWYHDHPDSILYDDPFGNYNHIDKTNYHRVPAYYQARELPIFAPNYLSEFDEQFTGQLNSLRYSFDGFSVGINANYAIYYAKKKHSKWISRMEEMTYQNLVKVVATYNEEHPDAQITGAVNGAIMVVPNIYGFMTFAKDMLDPKRRKSDAVRKYGTPYPGLYLVPVNGSGAMQIRLLMSLTPGNAANYLKTNLMARDRKFRETGDLTFPLAYGDTPVLVAHLMEYHQLLDALEQQEQGREFLISCLPEQVKYLRYLFPKARFL